VDLDKIVLGDDSLSAREIWGAEYQENVCVLVKKENVEYTKGVFPLQGNSRARAYDAPDGLIKVLADKKTSRREVGL